MVVHVQLKRLRSVPSRVYFVCHSRALHNSDKKRGRGRACVASEDDPRLRAMPASSERKQRAFGSGTKGGGPRQLRRNGMRRTARAGMSKTIGEARSMAKALTHGQRGSRLKR